MLLALAALAPPAHAQDTNLTDGYPSSQEYILQVSGTILNESFNGATMRLLLGTPDASDPNPYQIVAAGFPDSQSRNVFFWNSSYSAMEANADTITCTIRPSSTASKNVFFAYLSPTLLKLPNLTHRDKENRQKALKSAVPSVVPAQAGELRLTVKPNSVSGTVWLQGYDTIENSYVRYNATFSGTRAAHLEQKTQRTYR